MDDQSLVLGFMPVGLAYHAVFSICCAILGGLAIKHVWPHDLKTLQTVKTDSKIIGYQSVA